MMLLLFIVSSFFPSDLVVQREITINATKAEVYQEIAILRNWTHWALSEDEIKQVQGQFEGNIEGTGATYSWYLEDGVQNQMEITKTEGDSLIEMTTKTSAGYLATTTFIVKDVNGKTKVTWNEISDLGWNPVNKILIGLVDAESQIGEKYQLALETLKNYIEKE